MKYVLLLITITLLVSGCRPGNETASQEFSPEDLPGYTQLSKEVYVSDDMAYPEASSLAIYDIVAVDRDLIHQNLLAWLGDGGTYEEVTYDNQKEIHYHKGDLQVALVATKDPSNLSFRLVTPQGSLADSLISYTMTIQDNPLPGQDLVKITDFQGPLTLDRAMIEPVMAELTDILRLGMEFEATVLAMSAEDILQAQGVIPEIFSPEEYSLELVEEPIQEFYWVKLVPTIQGIPVIDDSVRLGDTDQVNVISGVFFTAIINESGLAYTYVTQLRMPGEEKDTVQVDPDLINQSIASLFADLMLEEPIKIDRMTMVYAPIPLNKDGGNNYTQYEYRPLIELTYTIEGVTLRRFIDPQTGLEVR